MNPQSQPPQQQPMNSQQILNKVITSDKDLEENLKSLFYSLRGKTRDPTVAVSTLMTLLINLKVDQDEPEFFNFVWKKFNQKQVDQVVT